MGSGDDHGAVPRFENRRVAYLAIVAEKFQLSSSKFYRDCSVPGRTDTKDGASAKVLVNADGTIDESEVRKYCQGLDKIEADIGDLDNPDGAKSVLQAEKLREEIDRLRRERKKDEGEWVSKSDYSLQMIAALTLVDDRVRQEMDGVMVEVCQLLKGDGRKLNDAKDLVENRLEQMWNELATSDVFKVEFKGF